MKIVTFQAQNHFIKALIFGRPGSGKTTFASTAPSPIFLSAEAGLLSIAHKKPHAIIISTLKDLQDAYHYLNTEKHGYKTVVIDSITEINEIVKAEIEQKNNRGISKNDWGEVLSKLKKIIRDFRDLPMHCIFLAQESIEKDDDTIVRIYPSLNGKAATEILAACDVVGYLEIDRTLSERYMVVKEHSVLATKNRLSALKSDNPSLDFSEWVKQLNCMDTGDCEIVASHEAPPEADPNAPPEFKKPIVEKAIGDKRVDPETIKLLDGVWSNFMKIAFERFPDEKDEAGELKYRPSNSEDLKLASIRKLYIVKSQSDLTERQALDFMQRIDGKIGDFTAGKKEDKKPPETPEAPGKPEPEPSPEPTPVESSEPVQETPYDEEIEKLEKEISKNQTKFDENEETPSKAKGAATLQRRLWKTLIEQKETLADLKRSRKKHLKESQPDETVDSVATAKSIFESDETVDIK